MAMFCSAIFYTGRHAAGLLLTLIRDKYWELRQWRPGEVDRIDRDRSEESGTEDRRHGAGGGDQCQHMTIAVTICAPILVCQELSDLALAHVIPGWW